MAMAAFEELDFGKSWQRTLMEGVIAMESVTGVKLSGKSQQAFEDNQFMHRNNLWTPEQFASIEIHKARTKTKHIGHN